MDIEMIKCSVCGELMPLCRLTKFGYNFCTKCSNVGSKRGIPVQKGSGDHTWTETIIVEEKEFYKFNNQNPPKQFLEDDDCEEI